MIDKPTSTALQYEIRLKGHLDARWDDRFEGLTFTLENGDRLLSGPMADQAAYPVYTFEILLALVMPLLVLYIKGNWPLRKVIPPLVIIPILWYFTYAPLHELSHAVGAYLVGGKVIDCTPIPRFWLGEFAGAWITPCGINQWWSQLTMTAFPYLLDVVCFIVAIFVFRKNSFRNPFLITP